MINLEDYLGKKVNIIDSKGRVFNYALVKEFWSALENDDNLDSIGLLPMGIELDSSQIKFIQVVEQDITK